jgi:hypothetical protein
LARHGAEQVVVEEGQGGITAECPLLRTMAVTTPATTTAPMPVQNHHCLVMGREPPSSGWGSEVETSVAPGADIESEAPPALVGGGAGGTAEAGADAAAGADGGGGGVVSKGLGDDAAGGAVGAAGAVPA